MTSFTKGPWQWLDRASDKHWDYQNEGLIVSGKDQVCNFGDNETYYNTAGTAPNEDDRRLICAAPDLYEALEWALNEIDGFTRYDREGQRTNAKALAYAALDKARGE